MTAVLIGSVQAQAGFWDSCKYYGSAGIAVFGALRTRNMANTYAWRKDCNEQEKAAIKKALKSTSPEKGLRYGFPAYNTYNDVLLRRDKRATVLYAGLTGLGLFSFWKVRQNHKKQA